MTVRVSDFKPGLVLVRRIVRSPLGYHYGIWVAVDEVIHASKTKRIVVCDPLEGFSAGLDVSVSGMYSALSKSPPEHVVERARAEVGKWSYELMDGNCEAFVHWCVTGEKSPGLQMGAVKLVGELADTLVVAPAKAARERDEARRGIQRQMTQILDDNAREDVEALREMENAVAASRAYGAAVVTDGNLEELMVRHGEYHAILHRWRGRRRRRSSQHFEMAKAAIDHVGVDGLGMTTPLLEAERRCTETSEDARKSLTEAATRLHDEVQRYLFDHMREDPLYDKMEAYLKRLSDQFLGTPMGEKSAA